MKRRRFLCAGVVLAGAGVGIADALAQAAPARRIGVLRVVPTAAGARELQAFRDRLRELGHVEGGDIVIDVRSAEGRAETLPRLAVELAALKPAVIVTGGSSAAQAVLKSDPAVPIVVLIGDAVETGLAAELKRPGGRITGVSFLASSLDAKRLELLGSLLRSGDTVMNLSDPNARTGSGPALAAAARSLGLSLHDAVVRTPSEIDAAFVIARQRRFTGVNVLSSSFLNAHRKRIIGLASDSRLPSIFQWPESAEDGGLIGYGPRFAATHALLATYASKIVKGAKPSELPIEQPTVFELVINAKTARAIGVTLPPALLARADRIIE